MSETLYRKYRPKNFSEIIGQQHVVRTLSNAVTSGRIGHAYLFTGPRGTGKTSIARILAKTVNCTNLSGATSCEKCQSCEFIGQGKSLDIIEIDAASNTGVDNIRELRETIALPPTSLKYKVYIIDEVHMLSTGAFNALLKTLEEPPAHVIFILATTEIHKVPDTVLSRCQRFDFSRLPITNIIEKLSSIAASEKVKIEKEALEMIAIAAEGGMRDAESLLGQIITLDDKNISAKEVTEILGTTSRKLVIDVAEMIVKNDATGAITQINKILEDGFDLSVFNKALINNMRQLMLLKLNPALKEYFTYELTTEQLEQIIKLAESAQLAKIIQTINLLLEAQNKINSFILPQLPLEIAIIKATQTLPDKAWNMEHGTWNNNQENTKLKIQSKIQNSEEKKDIKDSKSIAQSSDESQLEPQSSAADNNAATEQSHDESEETNNTAAVFDLYTVKSIWNRLLVDIRPLNHSLSALLTNCQATTVSGREITIATPYEFYKERLDDNANRLTIEAVFSKILGAKIIIRSAIDKSLAKPSATEDGTPEKDHEQDSLLSSAMEIMGGKVVEE